MKQLTLPSSLLLLLGFVFFSTSLQAQRTCAADEMLQEMRNHDSEQAAQIDQTMRQIYQQANANNNASRMDTIYTIPVVFHVVWNDSAENISDKQLLSQIEVLNEDFRRLNADTVDTPADFLPVAGDAKIEFCLATFDPDGNPTTGITRTQTTHAPFGTSDDLKFDSLGGKSAWPTDQYLNFWVANLGGGLLGYAQFPGGTSDTDGIACVFDATGRIENVSPPYHTGRTATHEIGHWLGLRHVWGDGDCSMDDGIADTPLQEAANYGCQTFPSISCNNGPSGDQFMNYMDYSDDECFDMFSLGQIAVMRETLSPTGPRWSLFSSVACVNPAYNNVGIDTILSPIELNCGGELTIEVVLENFGQNVVTETPIYFTLDGNPLGLEFWTGSLDTGTTTTVIHLPATIGPGLHTLAAYTDGANNGNDPDLSNDTAYKTFEVLDNIGLALPFANGFEAPALPTDWQVINPDSSITWQRIEGISRWGTASYWMNNYDYPSVGEVDEFIIPDLDLTTFTTTGVGLSFYVSYAKYGQNTGFSDTLEVLVSTDCGATFQSRYKKFDGDLVTTAPTPTPYEPTAFWQWRKDWVDLSDLTAETGVSIKFKHTTNYENNLYLDNINIGVLYTVGIQEELTTGIVKLYPNPASQQVTVSIDAVKQSDLQLTMRDVTGRAVKQQEMRVYPGANQVQLSLEKLARGMYFVELEDGEGSIVQKLMVL